MGKVKSKFETFRQNTNIIIYGTNTFYGRLFDLVLLGVILISVILVMLETVKEIDLKYHRELIIFEWIITIFFTIEYILRIISIKKPVKYIFSFYGIVDLLAVVPMYFSLFFVGTSVLSILRSVRLLRLFKILKHPQFSNQSVHLKQALIASKGKILIFIYFMLVSSVLIGSIMYVVEGKDGGFTSIPISIYWTIVTLTTVGYGDISPITPLGQSIASLVMIMGYGIIAVPTGIVSAEFASFKSRINAKDKINPCPNCGEEGHELNAKYCYNCGQKL
ncbi:voltage-gated potassium channel [Flavobacterium segetis]|uniref:Voltage-gated potassium channel n=1 Tax=Flavobacterium segetis TaxID=271157 RepID=A0A1M5HS68_9FLAO|nr:ion transporter [Flavobacterium segetis]SHG18811.1 voltage-gated potassium channel [Flavobacterium segetis]